MIPLEDAQARVLELAEPLEAVDADLSDALGCVTAAPVVASADQAVPPFANSAMDGYAVRAADTDDAPVTLAIAGTVAAGQAPTVEVGPGRAVRIMTGAPMPQGADAVVMVERTRADGEGVVIESAVRAGDHVRHPGEDIAPGTEVVAAGTVLGPAHLGVLASLGRPTVRVIRRPVVGVLSTGDELVPPGAELRLGQIRDTNRPTLLALVQRTDATTLDLGSTGDERDALVAALEDAATRCDLVVTSGGVSMGDFDYLKQLLTSVQVAIKPAKPLAYGVIAGTPILGLPGNPVSALVAFQLFALPAIRCMQGHGDPIPRRVLAVVAEDLRRTPDGKLHLQRVLAEPGDDGRLRVRSAGGQASHQLHAAAQANALALLPDGDGAPAGSEVAVLLLP